MQVADNDGRVAPDGGRTTLILVCVFLAPFFLELPLVGLQRIETFFSAAPRNSLGHAVGALAFLGSIPANFAAILAVVTLFRPGVTWSRKGLIWGIVFSAFLLHRLALGLLQVA